MSFEQEKQGCLQFCIKVGRSSLRTSYIVLFFIISLYFFLSNVEIQRGNCPHFYIFVSTYSISLCIFSYEIYILRNLHIFNYMTSEVTNDDAYQFTIRKYQSGVKDADLIAKAIGKSKRQVQRYIAKYKEELESSKPKPKIDKRRTRQVSQPVIDTPVTTDENASVDPSYKRLIDYKKYSDSKHVDIPVPTILQLLDKTDQLEQQEKEILDQSILVDEVDELILKFLAGKIEPKVLEWLRD